jgi:hypothetical protein
MREAFQSAARGYEESPVPLKHLEWLDEDLRVLYQLGRASELLLPYRRLGAELRKGWLPDWVREEIHAAIAAIDSALSLQNQSGSILGILGSGPASSRNVARPSAAIASKRGTRAARPTIR